MTYTDLIEPRASDPLDRELDQEERIAQLRKELKAKKEEV